MIKMSTMHYFAFFNSSFTCQNQKWQYLCIAFLG
jgi:hypothetical protein